MELIIAIIFIACIIVLLGWWFGDLYEQPERPDYSKEAKEFYQKLIDAGPGTYGDMTITKEFHERLKRNMK